MHLTNLLNNSDYNYRMKCSLIVFFVMDILSQIKQHMFKRNEVKSEMIDDIKNAFD